VRRQTQLLHALSKCIYQPFTDRSFHNRDDIDFALASDLVPTETINTIPPTDLTHYIDVAEYPIKRVNFNNVRNLTMFIEDNWSGGDEELSRLWYIGFKGEWTELKDAPLVTVYEVSPLDIVDTDTCESGGSQKGTCYVGSEAWFWALALS
jgi:PITH domain